MCPECAKKKREATESPCLACRSENRLVLSCPKCNATLDSAGNLARDFDCVCAGRGTVDVQLLLIESGVAYAFHSILVEITSDGPVWYGYVGPREHDLCRYRRLRGPVVFSEQPKHGQLCAPVVFDSQEASPA
jgi:hypothetical protein